MKFYEILLVIWLLVGFESQQLARSQNVQFDYETHVGVSQIRADGNPLLLGCGHGFIGSLDNVDNDNNITSCHPNNGGIMMPFNLQGNVFLKHQLHYSKQSNQPRRLYFGGEWGPSTFDFASVSMPTDGRRSKFTHWRDSSGAIGQYGVNPDDTYRHEGTGATVKIHSRGIKSWGEMIGPDYTVRVVVTGTTKPIQLFFVDHPGIDVRNVEFSWIGGAEVNAHANITGYIEVYRTNSNVFGGNQEVLTFEAESHNWHEIGRRVSGGWSADVRDTRNRFLNYGPYTQRVVAGNRRARFRMKIDNNTADTRNIVTIDVYDANSGQVLKRKHISRNMFSRANRYQGFDLRFVAPHNGKLEFRVYYRGYAKVTLDRVRVF